MKETASRQRKSFLDWARSVSMWLVVLSVGAASLAGAETVLHVDAKHPVVQLQYNEWTWQFVDEHGKPLSDVMVYTPSFSGSYSYEHQTIAAIGETFNVPADAGPIALAIRDWVLNNPEPLELPQVLNMYGEILPMALAFRTWADANGRVSEHRVFGLPIVGSYRLFFKPGYQPVALFYDFTPALQSGVDPTVVVTLKSWPERLAGLAKRPWITENLTLQQEMLTRWRAKSNAFSRSIFAKAAPGKDPVLPWQQTLRHLHEAALDADQLRDAAWLQLAGEYVPHRAEHNLDISAGSDDLAHGRVYQALEKATQLAPEIALLRARRSMRQFVLQFPNGLTQDSWSQLASGEPKFAFNPHAAWTPEIVESYVNALEPFSEDPFLALRVSGGILCAGLSAGSGLLERSAPEVADRFFRHRANLREALLRQYPTANWFAVGFDPWDQPYQKKFGTTYLQAASTAH